MWKQSGSPGGQAFPGSRQASNGVTKRKHAELPGEPAANTSVLLTTKVRDRDKGTENGEKQGEMASKLRDAHIRGAAADNASLTEHSTPSARAHEVLGSGRDTNDFPGRTRQGMCHHEESHSCVLFWKVLNTPPPSTQMGSTVLKQAFLKAQVTIGPI